MVTDHTFVPRFVYQGEQRVELPDQCGHVIDQMHNAPAADPVHCNKPAAEHGEYNYVAEMIRMDTFLGIVPGERWPR
jgi:hypothetical protein